MRSIDLAHEVDLTVQRCKARVLGVGDSQYSQGDTQKFETMEFSELIDWTLEELDDVVVYAVMLGIQVRRLRETLDEQSIIRARPGSGMKWLISGDLEAGVADV
jgi:hypothetical protein